MIYSLLYVHSLLLQLGQVWITSLQPSMQNGAQAQPHHSYKRVYVAMCLPQLGQRCCTSDRSSIQNGSKQHPIQHPNRQSIPAERYVSPPAW